MKYKEALSSLRHKKNNKFGLVGNEPYLKEYFIKVARKVYHDYSIEAVFPDEQSEAINLLRSDSLFDDKFIIINHLDKMEIEKFEESIRVYDGYLVISFSEGAKVKSRAVTKVLSDLSVVECTKLREYGMDYPSWIRSQIIEEGFKAADGVDGMIFKRVGPNMYGIARELEKLFIFKNSERFISPGDVKKIVPISAVSTAFELFECLLKRNISEALRCFSSYARGHDNFFEIIAFMGSYLEKMYNIILLRERNFEKDDIADIVGMPRFLLKTRYLPWALSFEKGNIAQKIHSICNLNVQLRLFKGDKKILFEKFIYSFSK